MSALRTSILEHLAAVARERRARAEEPALSESVLCLKQYQQARFERSYADLLCEPRFAVASRFFLDDIYGPRDFTDRDAQFARIVPALIRLFPVDVAKTVARLSELHALTEQLDSEMARNLRALPITEEIYADAWCETGRPACRERQIQLTLQIGLALDTLTRRKLIRHSLQAMRVPASAAGLGELQAFLERGFAAFAKLNGAEAFLDLIVARERSFAADLFGPAVRAGIAQAQI